MEGHQCRRASSGHGERKGRGERDRREGGMEKENVEMNRTQLNSEKRYLS